jgi:DNA-binding response OmpR family regulator
MSTVESFLSHLQSGLSNANRCRRQTRSSFIVLQTHSLAAVHPFGTIAPECVRPTVNPSPTLDNERPRHEVPRLKQFCILVVEDDPVTSITVGKALRLGMPDALVLNAHSLNEDRLTLKEYNVSFFVLDIHLPDGSGIDFIFDVTVKSPEATIVLMTNMPLPEYRAQAEAFGVMHFLEKPVNNRTLVSLVKESRSGQGVSSDTSLFNASLSRLTALDIIQLKCLNSATQTVVFKSKQHGSGQVCFRNGEITHASTRRTQGIAALSEIIGWRSGYAAEVSDKSASKRTITGSWQSVLLLAAHSTDEQLDENNPRPARPPDVDADTELGESDHAEV